MKNQTYHEFPVMNRRRFLSSLVAMAVAPGLLPFWTNAKELIPQPQQEFWISAEGKDPDSYGIGWINEKNRQAHTGLTGFRGHGASQHPLQRDRVVMYARRPGILAIELNLRHGSIRQVFQCVSGRHLFGHGCFSADGKTLFTSEADFKTGDGKIGIRDAQTYQYLGEYSSYGIGPHEIKLMPDGKTLVVANGGIRTHPDSGRKPLNLDSMISSLTYIDIANGARLAEYRVPEPKASIRHLDVASDGTVAIAMQMQREAAGHNKMVPLAALHKPGKGMEWLVRPETIIAQMQDYIGSVAVNNKTGIAGFASPRGNLAGFWRIKDGEWLGYHRLHDVCGIAVSRDQQHFLISNSGGEIRMLDGNTLMEDKSHRLALSNLHWDNHLLVANL